MARELFCALGSNVVNTCWNGSLFSQEKMVVNYVAECMNDEAKKQMAPSKCG